MLRWDPLRDMASLRTELSRLMNGLGRRGPADAGLGTAARCIRELEDAVTYSFDLPGVAEEDIAIEAEDGRLTVSASREQSGEIDAERFHRLERRYGTYSRTVGLPQGVSEDAITRLL